MSIDPSRQIITLTTDFGLADHYVGVMKGVLLTRCPQATLVDITHEIPAFNLYAAAYAIDQAALFFPGGTVHVVVVDPGVGTDRKAILVEALGQIFVAPDNGVLSLIAGRSVTRRVREIANRELFLPVVSSTFHGRDIFAPVAAAVARGLTPLQSVGPLIERLEVLPDLAPVETAPGVWQGRVLSVDRFGNLITNFKMKERFSLEIAGKSISAVRQTFGAREAPGLFAYLGSSGFIEVALNRQNAAKELGISPGEPICLRDTIS